MAGFLSPATREHIRAASDIVDVIGSYLPLKRAGANFTALCPFHKEKSPSFNVNPHKQIFHCFVCGTGGDVFTFVEGYHKASKGEALRMLAKGKAVILLPGCRPVLAGLPAIWNRPGHVRADLTHPALGRATAPARPAIEAPHREPIAPPYSPPAITDIPEEVPAWRHPAVPASSAAS